MCSLHSSGKKIPRKIRRNFTNCYGAGYDHTDLIRFDGYYDSIELGMKTGPGGKPTGARNDSFKLHFMFFKDGTVLFNMVYSNARNLSEYLQHAAEAHLPPEQVYGGYWGIYKITHDTIIVQYVNSPSAFAPWFGGEVRYKVNGDKTLDYLGSRMLESKSRFEYNVPVGHQLLPAKFIKCALPGEPHSWLKDMDWTKCH
jgi:hypothetical protein